nr:EOG090X0BTZ [Eurycercus lamellatus]
MFIDFSNGSEKITLQDFVNKYSSILYHALKLYLLSVNYDITAVTSSAKTLISFRELNNSRVGVKLSSVVTKVTVVTTMSNTNEEIQHYQRKIDKYSSDTKVLLHCLNKLTRLPIGVEHLQATGIGRTVNGMRKAEGAVGETARQLVKRWKEMVAAEDEKSESDGQEDETHDDEDLDVPINHHKHKKVKETKERGSLDDQLPSTSRSKNSSSRSKSPDKQKVGEKRKSLKEGDSSKSTSKSSKKRRHSSQEDSSSQAEDKEGDDVTSRSFADALGSIETVGKKKKSKDKDRHREEKKSKVASTSNFTPPSALAAPPVVKQILAKPIDIRPTDFEISPYYKPLPLKLTTESPPALKSRTTEEALSVAMAQKGSRTKVFSGNRSSGLSYVPTLFETCTRVLQQNIEALEFTGGVPYELLRPVLERATSQQLYALENYNSYLLDDTDELWELLCKKEYKKALPEEMESWRELYLRCHEEREARLKNLTMSHKQSMAKAVPVRTTKLAYVESVAKAPRGAGKPGQIKQGASAVLASMTNAKAGARPFEASTNHPANGAVAVAEVVKMAPPSAARSSTSSSSSSAAAKKPKVAPLMQKTLKLMKNRFRR